MATIFLSLRGRWAPFFNHSPVPSSCKTHLLCSSTAGQDPPSPEIETFQGPIPREKLKVSFSKSSGPGGQNVNKLNTKAEVRFHVSSADWLPERVRERVLSMFRSRVTRGGELVVVCQDHRSQLRNLETAVEKLEQLLREASEVPRGPSQLTLSRIRALKKVAQHRRRVEKKYHSQKKQDRITNDFD